MKTIKITNKQIQNALDNRNEIDPDEDREFINKAILGYADKAIKKVSIEVKKTSPNFSQSDWEKVYSETKEKYFPVIWFDIK